MSQTSNPINFPTENTSTSLNAHFLLPDPSEESMEDCLIPEAGLLPPSECNMLGIESDLNDIFK